MATSRVVFCGSYTRHAAAVTIALFVMPWDCCQWVPGVMLYGFVLGWL